MANILSLYDLLPIGDVNCWEEGIVFGAGFSSVILK